MYNVPGIFLGNFACMKSLAVLAPCRLLFVITAAAWQMWKWRLWEVSLLARATLTSFWPWSRPPVLKVAELVLNPGFVHFRLVSEVSRHPGHSCCGYPSCLPSPPGFVSPAQGSVPLHALCPPLPLLWSDLAEPSLCGALAKVPTDYWQIKNISYWPDTGMESRSGGPESQWGSWAWRSILQVEEKADKLPPA